jgi:small GTP-binding protein
MHSIVFLGENLFHSADSRFRQLPKLFVCPDARMKVILVGDTQVGKTCLLSRLTTGQFQGIDQPTIGAAFQDLTIAATHGAVSLQIWDTAGQEKYRSLAPMYYRNARAAILVFDLTNHDTFRGLAQWIRDLGPCDPNARARLFVVGNKCDLAGERVIDAAAAQRFADENQAVAYYETSAATGYNVIELFTDVADGITRKKSDTTELEPVPEPRVDTECGC